MHNSISLLLITDSVSLSCSPWSEEFKILTLQVLAKPLKACSRFVIFTLFLFKNFLLFSVSLYNLFFSACFIGLDNLCEVFKGSLITLFYSSKVWAFKSFWLISN